MPESPAEPAAGPAAPAAAAGAVQPAGARRRLAASLLGATLLVAALLFLARELIAARVPEHRAALEALIREQTGLEVTFSQLTVRWGWYGPEAVFHRVALGEAGAPALLRAPELSVGLDAWRMVRSGHLEAGRITLLNPDIDLTGGVAAGAGTPASAGAPRANMLADAPRLLSRWRGGRIDIEGGALRWLEPGSGHPVSVDLMRADLRRLGANWSADVQLLLPDRLGASARFTLRLTGDVARTEDLSGTLTFEGERLAFGGWRALEVYARYARYLPQGGSGNLNLQATIARGRIQQVAGLLHADALEWPAPTAASAPLRLPRLRADWQLARAADGWRLAVGALDLGAAGTGTATVLFTPDTARGSLHRIPLAAAAAFARWYLPQWPLEPLTLGGEFGGVDFDWDARRRAGTRLAASAQGQGLRLASATQDLVLEGLAAQLTASEERISAQLSAQAARLLLVGPQPLTLDGLQLSARLGGTLEAGQWQLRTEDLDIRRGETRVSAQAAIAFPAGAAPRRLDTRLEVSNADAPLVARLVGPQALAAFGAAASRLTAGRITSGTLELHGTFEAGAAADTALSSSHGAFQIEDAVLAATEAWPEVRDLAAHLQWQGARVQAQLTRASSGTLELSAARAQWDAGGEQPLRVSGRVSGSAQDLLQWLRTRPELARYAPGAQYLDLQGDTLLDVDLLVPGSAARQPPARTRITAVLEGASLRPLAGLPAIEALRGTLAFAGGHLQHSMLSGQWLGGPVSLAIGERREHGTSALTVSGRGLLDVRQALLAAGADSDATTLGGNPEWTAQLTLLPEGEAAPPHWQVRADSSLIGLASRLPEPLAKGQNAPLPLHLEVQGDAAAARLHLNIGERLAAVAALERSGDAWRIERGAVRLSGGTPVLPSEPLLALEGRVSRFELSASLSLWQQAARSPLLPALEAHLSAAELAAGERVYPDVHLSAAARAGGGQLQLESAANSVTLQWPALVDAGHPAVAHLANFDAESESDAALGALTSALGPLVQLSVDELRWRGRALGRLRALIGAQESDLTVKELTVSGASQELTAQAQCSGEASCSAHFTLASTDAAATLAAFGLRADLSAARAQLQGELQWPQGSDAPLATVSGHLHMQLEDGATHAVEAPASAPPFALFLVPGLLTALAPEPSEAKGEAPAVLPLRFSRLSADFELRDGDARTANLHLDGEAEILVRARVGLLAQDYDGQAFILRGEERLPSAVRRFGPTPKVAALWLSLREWFTGSAAENARAALRLRGTWNDPIVMPAE